MWRGGRVVEQWMRDRDLLTEETLAFAQRVAAAKPVRIETSTPIQPPKSFIQPNLPKPKDRLFRDEELEKRLSEFKAVQHRFEREREEFFEKTMSKVRLSSSRDGA